MESRRDVFQAIADPTRRQIIEKLVQKTLNMNEIAENFDVTRQAVSLHINILSECGLIVIKKQGRERYCEVKIEEINHVAEWVNFCRKLWKEQFSALDKYLTQIQSSKS